MIDKVIVDTVLHEYAMAGHQSLDHIRWTCPHCGTRSMPDSGGISKRHIGYHNKKVSYKCKCQKCKEYWAEVWQQFADPDGIQFDGRPLAYERLMRIMPWTRPRA